MCKVLRLVEPKICKDTIEALEEALQKARRGELVGIALIAMHSKDLYYVDIAGLMKRCPTLGRGMTRTLDDRLASLAD